MPHKVLIKFQTPFRKQFMLHREPQQNFEYLLVLCVCLCVCGVYIYFEVMWLRCFNNSVTTVAANDHDCNCDHTNIDYLLQDSPIVNEWNGTIRWEFRILYLANTCRYANGSSCVFPYWQCDISLPVVKVHLWRCMACFFKTGILLCVTDILLIQTVLNSSHCLRILWNNENWTLYLFILYINLGFETQDRFFLVTCVHQNLLVQPQADIIIQYHNSACPGAAQGQRYNEWSACLSRHKIRVVNWMAM
jgi:hypothetical protein